MTQKLYRSNLAYAGPFCLKRGCYKHANPLGLRLNPGLWGLPTTGSRIWGPFKQNKTNGSISQNEPLGFMGNLDHSHHLNFTFQTKLWPGIVTKQRSISNQATLQKFTYFVTVFIKKENYLIMVSKVSKKCQSQVL